MRRPAFAALCAASALAIGIPASLGLTASGADDQVSRPLSQVPKVERFGQAALDAQSAFLKRMPDTEIRYGENGAISWLQGRTESFSHPAWLNSKSVRLPKNCWTSLAPLFWPPAQRSFG